jgi:hypothetical protein
MLRLGSITVGPPTNSRKFVAECTVEILDPTDGTVLVTIRDISIGKSEWGPHKWFASIPTTFVKRRSYDKPTAEMEIIQPVCFPPHHWRVIADRCIAEYLKWPGRDLVAEVAR